MNRWMPAGLAAVMMCALASARPAAAQNAPFAGGGLAVEKDPAVDKLVAEAEKLDKQVKAKPKDAKLKEKTAEAHYKAGHTMMLSALSPRVKYRGALKHFRRCLELNPKHKEAAAEKKQIEDIYKQMGRPVPT